MWRTMACCNSRRLGLAAAAPPAAFPPSSNALYSALSLQLISTDIQARWSFSSSAWKWYVRLSENKLPLRANFTEFFAWESENIGDSPIYMKLCEQGHRKVISCFENSFRNIWTYQYPYNWHATFPWAVLSINRTEFTINICCLERLFTHNFDYNTQFKFVKTF